jgi:malate dehydrogenase (oxaloacetate-decarboxylating)(NADP+)
VQGLVIKSRTNLQHHKLAFAHECEAHPGLLSTIHAIRPTALIGVSTSAGAFTRSICEAMAQHNERPIIFPLSNPTHLAECTFAQALEWTAGRVLFASGSPFDPVTQEGATYHPAQANNAYVFPAIGHAAVLSRAMQIPDKVFLVAASVLSKATSLEQLDRGWVFPPFDNILDVSKAIMAACCSFFEESGLGCKPGLPWMEVIDQSLWASPTPSKL